MRKLTSRAPRASLSASPTTSAAATGGAASTAPSSTFRFKGERRRSATAAVWPMSMACARSAPPSSDASAAPSQAPASPSRDAATMRWMVAFLSSPADSGAHVGPLFVHAYGLLYAIGVFAAMRLTAWLWTGRGGRHDWVFDVALFAFPAGLIGGRLYFLATSWNQVPATWWGPFAVWRGGLGIWGGIALGTAVGIWRLRRARVAVASFMDCAAPGLLVAQAVGRIGNYFNQELFGAPTSLPWGLRIDTSHRPAGYEHFSTSHPTFLYELIFDLALAAALIVLGRRGRV